jgi:phospholipid/cholesterol/gamma-HCH transport system substrate-binding protein
VKKALQRYSSYLVAVIGIVILALVLGGYILSNQRFYLPAWVPVLGTDFYIVNAEMETAQAIMPGQGQTVNIAGVPVGEIGQVKLRKGKAVVELKLRRQYAPVYNNAQLLLRPKTALNDMFIEMERGTPSAGEVKDGGTVSSAGTKANVAFDEILSAFDTDSRDYIQLLLNGAREGLDGNGKALANAFRRFEPTARDGAKAGKYLEARRKNIARSVHNLGLLSRELGDNKELIERFIDSSNTTFQAFASESQAIRESVQLAPNALGATADALEQIEIVANDAGPAFADLQGFAENFGDAMRGLRPFFRDQTIVTRDQFRPFAVNIQPVLRELSPASKDLAALTPNADRALKSFNVMLNMWGYNPKGSAEGYIAWLSWFNHLNSTLFNSADAHGVVRSGVTVATCPNWLAATSLASGGSQAAEPFQVLLQLLGAPQPKSC